MMLPFCLPIASNKILPTPIIGSFNGFREKTRGKFVPAPMVAEAFTTNSFPGTRITAVTRTLVFLYITFCHFYVTPISFLNSVSSMRVSPSFFAFSYFEPGSEPTTT